MFVSRKIPEDEFDKFAKWRSGYQMQKEVNVVSMEVCTYGDLFSVVNDHGPIRDDSLLRYVFLQVCKGTHALHTKVNLVHLDLKLENILIAANTKVKICDFGMAQPVAKAMSKTLGTKYYCAPEVHSAN